MKYSSEHSDTQSKSMPDVAIESSANTYSALPWVGMGKIEVPALWSAAQGQAMRIPCRVDAQVSLDLKASRGIHMSRLYLLVQEFFAEQNLQAQNLQTLTRNFLESQDGLSSQARVAVEIEIPVKRAALKSENSGWRNYPVIMASESLMRGPSIVTKNYFEVKVSYSSTCPASAALSRQITSAEFLKTFPNGAPASEIAAWLETPAGMAATPHAQRSEARVLVEIAADSKFTVIELIDLIEGTLKTPVQAAVKREDEQEFARRNSQNLMFCEDAARRVQKTLETNSEILDFYGHFQHFESLHPHNAVSFIQKPTGVLSSFVKSSFQS